MSWYVVPFSFVDSRRRHLRQSCQPRPDQGQLLLDFIDFYVPPLVLASSMITELENGNDGMVVRRNVRT